MFNSFGKLHYDKSDGYRLVLKVNQDLADYYRTLIPKYCRTYKQGWAAHLTVVRPEFDLPQVNKWTSHNSWDKPKWDIDNYWGKYQGEEVKFVYSSILEEGKGFHWFNAWSKRLEEIREELGLINVSKYPLIPDGYKKTFHCTVARYDVLLDNNSGEAPEK